MPELTALAANRSFLATEKGAAWVVERGHVLVFAVELDENGSPMGQRHLVATLEPGDLVVSVQPTRGQPLAALLVGAGEAEVRRVEVTAVCAGELDGHDAAGAVESWVRALSSRLAQDRLAPNGVAALLPGAAEVPSGGAARPTDVPVAVRVGAGLAALCGQVVATTGPDDEPLLLGPGAWVEAVDAVAAEVTELRSAIGSRWFADALVRFGHLCFSVLAVEVALLLKMRQERTAGLAATEQEIRGHAIGELSSVLAGRGRLRSGLTHRDPAFAALASVLQDRGINLSPDEPGLQRVNPALPALERASLAARIAGCRARPVRLHGNWWREDIGPVVATVEGSPVALVRDWHGYVLHDPAGQSSRRVDATLAARVATEALTIYVPLAEGARKLRPLLRLGLSTSGHDVTALVLFGSVAGLASLVTPVLTGLVFNDVIPSDERGRLWTVVAVLVAVALGVAASSLVRGVAFIRVRARFSANGSSALWDRALRLAPGFFAKHPAGEVVSRLRAVEMAQQVLTDSVVASVLNAIFMLFNVFLFFEAGGLLFLVGLGLVVLQLGLVAVSALSQVDRAREQIAAQNRAQALSLQLVRGIGKLRVAAAERRAFAAWAHRFSRQSRSTYSSGKAGLPVGVLNSTWSTFSTLAVVGTVAAAGLGHVTVGSYIEFTTALAQVGSAIGSLVPALGAIAVAVPIFELPVSVLDARSESGAGREPPGVLSGAVELSHVSFRYSPDGPLVLDDISLAAAPGEFVAIVGPSGAGKSSLVRLLLGFETPEAGTVAFDGKDLARLDITSVRRQLGTVVQSARLLPGSVFDNIAGGLAITRDEAWEAVAAAGVADDIRAMPMGMETLVSEGAGLVSGGQRQRILIARALALKPRVIIFDEATSALDNVTQRVVTESLARLAVTRIVVAHRLSTVQGADRIYVLARGKVVQVGSYDELVAQDGVFRRLALRQLL